MSPLILVDDEDFFRFEPSYPTDFLKKIKAYATSIGIPGFLNSTIVDYPLFTTKMSRKLSPEVIGNIMRKGKALGHSPSRSEILPNFKTSEVLNDPLGLMKGLAKLGLLTEMRGKYELSSSGLQLVNAEVIGRPKEWSLSKIWNVVKKAKERARHTQRDININQSLFNLAFMYVEADQLRAR